MKPTIILFLLCNCCLVLLSSCQKDDLTEDLSSEALLKSYNNVPESLWDDFRNFEREAAERGVNIDLSALNISAQFIEIEEDGIAGSCTYGSHSPGHITLDQTFWRQASDLFREMILFHELGHCALFQGHREGRFSNGTCASIMRSGLENCRDNYQLSTREAYLDELFSAP